MKIIAISGKMGSGKSTLVNCIQEMYLGNVEIMKFAGVLYEMHNSVKDIARSYGIDFPDKQRQLLQFLGTDLFRNNFGENVWVDIMINKIRKSSSYNNLMPDDLILIDDMRFCNEFDGLDVFGKDVLKVRLECAEEIRRERVGAAWNPVSHPSEFDLDHYAANGSFNLVFNTEKQSPENIAKTIFDAI